MQKQIYNNESIPNVFNDIVEYLKAHKEEHDIDEYSIDILSNIPNDETPNLSNKSFIVMYDAIKKDLYFQGKNDDIDFICVFNSLDDFSKKSATIFVHLQDVEADRTKKIYSAQVDLPASSYVDMQTTLLLPKFRDTTNNPSKEILKTFRHKLSQLLNEYFNELNNFYVQKVKNGDTRYNGAIYQYFYLPIIQIENN